MLHDRRKRRPGGQSRRSVGSVARERGFTLTELLVVVAIIAVLAGLLFPVFAQARASARMAATLSNYRQFAAATTLYTGDSDDFAIPNSPGMHDASGRWNSWKQIISPYVRSVGMFQDGLNPAARLPDPVSDPDDARNTPDRIARPRFNRGYYYYFPFFKTGHWSHDDKGAAGAMPSYSMGAVDEPARAILFSEAKEDFVDIGPWVPYQWHGQNGWDVPNWGGGKRDDRSMTLAFDDGHAKFTPIRRTCEGEGGVENMWQWDRSRPVYSLTDAAGATQSRDIAWVDTLCQTLPF